MAPRARGRVRDDGLLAEKFALIRERRARAARSTSSRASPPTPAPTSSSPRATSARAATASRSRAARAPTSCICDARRADRARHRQRPAPRSSADGVAGLRPRRRLGGVADLIERAVPRRAAAEVTPDGHRLARPPHRLPAHLAHRPLQPALRLLHARRGRARGSRTTRSSPTRRSSASRAIAVERGHRQDPPHRRRAARAPGRRRPRAPAPRDRRRRGHRAHHQRDAAAALRRASCATPGSSASTSASTRSTPRSTRASRAAASSTTRSPGSTPRSRPASRPVKLNVVVVRSLEQDLLGFAKMTLDRPLHVRFIEYMPVGDAEEGSGCHSDGTVDRGWTARGLRAERRDPRRASRRRASPPVSASCSPVARDDAPGGWGPARYYRFAGAQGTVGVISPLSHHFCAECNRLRLTADGRLRPCLFCDDELDVRTRAAHRAPTRTCAPSSARRSRSSPRTTTSASAPTASMSQIGG